MMPLSLRPLFLRYAVAPVAVGTTILLRGLLWPFGEQDPFLLLWPTILLCAWYGGRAPGLLAVALSTLGGGLLLLQPVLSGATHSATTLLSLASFFVLAAVTVLLVESVRQT